MQLFLNIMSVIVSIVLILTILVQQRGTGLGRAFGGSSVVYRTRRGAERFLFRLTIVLATAYVLIALLNILY